MVTLQIGDVVRFRLGERLDDVCPHCGIDFWTSKDAQALIDMSGRLFRVMAMDVSYLKEIVVCTYCGKCRGEFTTQDGECILSLPLDHKPLPDVVREGNWDGFTAFIAELTLVTKNELYAEIYGKEGS